MKSNRLPTTSGRSHVARTTGILPSAVRQGWPDLALLLVAFLTAFPVAAEEYEFTTLAGYPGYGSNDGAGSQARFNQPVGIAMDLAGQVYVADRENHVIRKISPAGLVSTFAGSAGLVGNDDGRGGEARFTGPEAVAVDRTGHVYVAANQTIRKITPEGFVTTLAGLAGNAGNVDGRGIEARFSQPRGIAVDRFGQIYVADGGNRTIRRISPEGEVTTLSAGGERIRIANPVGIAVDDSGQLFVADNLTIRRVSVDGAVTTLAGQEGNPGSGDGPGDVARFGGLTGLTLDRQGWIYVADSENATIRKVSPEGFVTTLAGRAGRPGSQDGRGSDARFGGHPPNYFPDLIGVAVDGNGQVYVADSGNNVVRQIAPDGLVTTWAGFADLQGGVTSDGAGPAARFGYPGGIAVGPDGQVFVLDIVNIWAPDMLVRKITPAGVVTTWEITSEDQGSSGPLLNYPRGIAVDQRGVAYVWDDHVIMRISPDGVMTVLAGMRGESGSADGVGTSARFSSISGLAVDRTGQVYVADESNCTVRRIRPEGVVTTLAGLAGSPGHQDGVGSAARFNSLSELAVDHAGQIYVVDDYTIRRITSDGVVTTLAGRAGEPGSVDGTEAARFSSLGGLAVDGRGQIYVADGTTIRRVSPEGAVTTLAGQPEISGSTDGFGADARFSSARAWVNGPNHVAADDSGQVYVADVGNRTIRKVSPEGWVTTLAGLPGSYPSFDGPVEWARFNNLTAIAVDPAGGTYVAEYNAIRRIGPTGEVTTFPRHEAFLNQVWIASGLALGASNSLYLASAGKHSICAISSQGIVTVLAGRPGFHGRNDGTGSAARFNTPQGIAVDGSGQIYVADSGNATIRKLSPDGLVTTLAGLSGTRGGADGIASAARFHYPQGIAVDRGSQIYVADSGNFTIRKITPEGVVTTLAGLAGTHGDTDGSGSSARFRYPTGLAVDADGNIYVSDYSTIRKITSEGIVTTVAGRPGAYGHADGIGSGVRFGQAYGLAVDARGRLYVADYVNTTVRRGGVALPRLQTRSQDGQTILAWPASANGYELESRESLLPGPGWEPVTSGVALEGTRFVVTNTPVQPAGFFRLSRP